MVTIVTASVGILLGAPGVDLPVPARGTWAGAAVDAAVGTRTAEARSKRSRRAKKRKQKICSRYRGKRRCKWVPIESGHGVSDAHLRTEALPRPSGELWIYAVNFREEVKVNIYDANGELDEDALARLDFGFRCRRTGEERAMDPRLYELLSVVSDHFDGKRIELVSAFRNQERETSRHFHASAVDFRVTGVSTRRLHEFIKSLDMGGMGIGLYPTSGFVHMDFRAPGEKSYRWTDYSGNSSKAKRRSRRRRNNS